MISWTRKDLIEEIDIIEEVLGEFSGRLVELEDVLLPTLEAKVRDIREVCKEADDILARLEHWLTLLKCKA
jgi:hypothetical protein